MFFRFFIFAISYILRFNLLFNRRMLVVKKSDIIENIDGADCYLHFVKKGETLYAIARAYDITVNDIFKTNPDARNGIKPGVILKNSHRKNSKSIKRRNSKSIKRKVLLSHC